jgi:hypothetical protein
LSAPEWLACGQSINLRVPESFKKIQKGGRKGSKIKKAAAPTPTMHKRSRKIARVMVKMRQAYCAAVSKSAKGNGGRFFSPRRAKRSVESSLAVHILSVFCLLLLAHAVNVIPRNLCVFGASEFGEAQAAPHEHLNIILLIGVINVHLYVVPSAIRS